MNYSIKIRLYSEMRHHGTHGPKTHAVRSAVASKARGLLKKKREESSREGSITPKGGMQNPDRKANKPYGTHSGNVHVQTLYSKDNLTVDEADRVLVYLDNLTSRFEAMSSFDVKSEKNRYARTKSDILEKYQVQFGTDLSEKNATQALKDLSKYSFDYTQHQIVVILSSDTPFDGSHLNVDGQYVRELRSKRIYSQGRNLLPKEVRDKLQNTSMDEVSLTKSASLGKGARIIVNPSTGRRELQIDFGQLGSRVFEVDSYA